MTRAAVAVACPMTDFRTRILTAVDKLQTKAKPINAEDVAFQSGIVRQRVAEELRAMRVAGIVVYDRKASGWRRA